MSVLVVGISHHSAPVDVLEAVALDEDGVANVLDEVHASDHLSEAVVVATCNRLELYADVATFHGGVDEASALLSVRTGVPHDQLTPHLYVHYEDRAVSHLFHVVSGLDAMVVGESQILGQVRDAFRVAQTSGTTGRVLTELFQSALRTGKRAHAETNIDLAGRSLVTVGLAQVLPQLTGRTGDWATLVAGKRVLVVGAGAMAALAASTVARAGANVTVVNRTFERAQRLAESLGATVESLAGLESAIDAADVVISCTGASGVVLPYEQISRAVEGRNGPLAIVDLALPHDVDPAVADLPSVALADLANLANAESADGGAVATEVEAVRAIVAQEVAEYAGKRRAAQVAPTVVALRTMADDVVGAELARLSGRLPDLDDRTRAEIVGTVRRVVDKLLHSPTVRVKELAGQPDGAAYEAALRELFALNPRSIESVVRPDNSTISTVRPGHPDNVESGADS